MIDSAFLRAWELRGNKLSDWCWSIHWIGEYMRCMSDAHVVEWIREKFVNLSGSLEERGRRRWAAIESSSLGPGSIAAVAAATCMSDRTIRTGIKELESGESFPPGRQRRQGAGRRSREAEQPPLLAALDKTIARSTRGDVGRKHHHEACQYARAAIPDAWTRSSITTGVYSTKPRTRSASVEAVRE
jgi:hypothetical protein